MIEWKRETPVVNDRSNNSNIKKTQQEKTFILYVLLNHAFKRKLAQSVEQLKFITK